MSSCNGFFTAYPNNTHTIKNQGALVVYLYSKSIDPVDITFKIEKIQIRQKKGRWETLENKIFNINSIDIAGNQILLSEKLLPAGTYTELRIFIADQPDVRWEEKRRTLALANPFKEISIGEINVETQKSSTLFLKWAPEKSIVASYKFDPAIKTVAQTIPAHDLLLYIANSGSNYLSIIDRLDNRVIGIINVGEMPTDIILTEEKEVIYVLNSKSRSISVINTYENYVLDRIQLISGIEPVEMAMIPYPDIRNNGKIYISNKGSNDVTVVDTSLMQQINTIRVGNNPLGIEASPGRKEVYVANTVSNTISVIDSQSDTLKYTINIDSKPTDIIIVNDKLYVLNSYTDTITIIDIATKKITDKIFAGINPISGIYSSQLDRLYLANSRTNQISFLIPSSSVITRSIKVGRKPTKLALDEERNHLYITNYDSNTVDVVNPTSEIVENSIHVGKNPYGITLVK